MPESHPLRRALPLYLLAGLCLSSLDATGKWLVQDFAVFLVVWARYAGQMAIVTPFAWQRAGPRFWRTAHLRLQLLRSAFLLAATACFFAGLRHLPLAEGSAITFLSPIFVVLLSQPLLGERPTRPRKIAAVLGFTGVVILVRPGSAVFHPAALLLLAAAFCNALYAILTRRLLAENTYTTLFYSALVGTVGLTLLLPWIGGNWPSAPLDIARFLALGAFAGAGHFLFIRAFGLAPASFLTPFWYLQVVWATFYGLVLFAHLPDALSFLGMAVIVSSGLGLAIHEHRRMPRC